MSTTNIVTPFLPTPFPPFCPTPLPAFERQAHSALVTTPAALEFASLEAWLASHHTLQLPLHQIESQQQIRGREVQRLLEGEPEHKDLYLTPEEQAANDQFTPCCSRSRSPLLVLDI